MRTCAGGDFGDSAKAPGTFIGLPFFLGCSTTPSLLFSVLFSSILLLAILLVVFSLFSQLLVLE